MQSKDGTGPLSPREVEVARAYADGLSYKQIARDLDISPATVRAHIRTIYFKLDVATKIDLAHALSQMRPVRAEVVAGNSSLAKGEALTRRTLRVACMPLVAEAEGLSESFALGLAEDIATELSRFHRITVIAPDSSARLQESSQLSDEKVLVDFTLRGRIRWQGQSVRLAMSLTHQPSGEQIWGENYDAPKEEIFRLQDRVVAKVASTVAGRAEAGTAARAGRKRPSDIAAYELVMRGKAIEIGDPTFERMARECFQDAIKLDETYALAHAKLAHMDLLEWDRSSASDASLLNQALDSAKSAASYDPSDPYCHAMLGVIHLFRQSFQMAERHLIRALELSPNDAELRAEMGLLKAFEGEADSAFSYFDQATDLDPYFDPSWVWRGKGLASFVAGDYLGAIDAFEQSVTSPPWSLAYVAACHGLAFQESQAQDAARKVLDIEPGFSARKLASKEPLKRQEDRDRLLKGLELAGLVQ